MPEALSMIMEQSTGMLDLVTALAAGLGLLAITAVRQGKGRSTHAVGLGWALAGFLLIATGSIISAFAGYIAELTWPDATLMVKSALTTVGLMCFALHFYRVGKQLAAPAQAQSSS